MALSKEEIKERLKSNIQNDEDFSKELYNIFKNSMDEFQNSIFEFGSDTEFNEIRDNSSIKFAESIKEFQNSLANLISKHISDVIDG